ncbi:flagellar hook-basal body complex protein [Lapillicoccus jejuensis]|uniref:Flagellar hook protein FlgE n=1 Tax=Lapillicoccus jejuensis TaxID=402171 RepID=A0A542E477_9MICO|nr:flagellar hook-basal body complex protein [Lapillicoccus jejuensis]TQJ10158.1 flagellar hook protein FlgE [Lapillicoccus jejuensis]
MLRSLFAGISGLRVNQTALDVTGNNIANASTVGFKSSGFVFQDTLSQMLTAGSSASTASGGTNAVQIGLGVQLAATNGNFTQGSAQTTGRGTDLIIMGDGMFVTRKGTEDLYTRAGSFNFDNTGTLVNPAGQRVQGYALDATGNPTGGLIDVTLSTANAQPAVPAGVSMTSYAFGPDGTLSGTFSDGQTRSLCRVAMANFVNPMGLERASDTSFRATANSGTPTLGTAGIGGMGKMAAGEVEMSNVDLAAEFTNLIIAQRGFEASSKVITTSDQILDDLVNIKR